MLSEAVNGVKECAEQLLPDSKDAGTTLGGLLELFGRLEFLCEMFLKRLDTCTHDHYNVDRSCVTSVPVW